MQICLVLIIDTLPPDLAIIGHNLAIICNIGGVEVEENINEVNNVNNGVKYKYCHRIILASSVKKNQIKISEP